MNFDNKHPLAYAIASLFLLSLACNFPTGDPPPDTPLPLDELFPPSETPTAEPDVIAPTEEGTPTAVPLFIGGVLWHEICDFTGGVAGEPLVLGLGCVQYGEGAGDWGPNQIYDIFEIGWEGVTLHLGAGACPSSGLATALSDGAGEYAFHGLNPGTYCVSYDNLSDGNDVILIPGGPTFPLRGEAGLEQTVELSSGASETNINFGYAFQFYN
jgi:hypothetical protein